MEKSSKLSIAWKKSFRTAATKRRSGLCKQRGDVRSGLENERKQLGAKRAGEEKEVQRVVLCNQKGTVFSKELYEDRSEEVIEDGF